MIVDTNCIPVSVILESPFTSLGCWKDNKQWKSNGLGRAIDGNGLGKLGEGSYSSHIQGCFERAKALGNDIFAIQSMGNCFTSATAGETYTKFGPSNDCSDDGVGGTYAMEVYKLGKMYIEQVPT